MGLHPPLTIPWLALSCLLVQACTFANGADADACQMCETPRGDKKASRAQRDGYKLQEASSQWEKAQTSGKRGAQAVALQTEMLAKAAKKSDDTLNLNGRE